MLTRQFGGRLDVLINNAGVWVVVVVGEGGGLAGGFGGRGGGDVEFFAVAGERDWTLVTHREGGGEVGSR